MTAPGTNFPFAALHKSGSYWGFICHAFTVARPVSFDPERKSWGGGVGAMQHSIVSGER
jgi:hypothetical protein